MVLGQAPHQTTNHTGCLQSLVATFTAGKSLVDEKAAQSAVTEVLD
ncbi:hypothetical protein [Streptomyces sp. Ncost-T10-10d]|nr:hypothetical protein [Streptomyces sp. Ncost-T10-10d]SCF56527.1 hypothetical protein GA0115254_100737 [Streptomyces sp. Ncost-T10-10d]